jgi:hypothetical protein
MTKSKHPDLCWAAQFIESLSIYLAKWYVITNIDLIEASCKKHGVKSLMKFTGGFYSADKIGCWVCSHHNALDRIHKMMKKSKDPIINDMHLSFVHNRSLHEALIEVSGKVIQDTEWWRNNIKQVRKLAYKTRIISQVMES